MSKSLRNQQIGTMVTKEVKAAVEAAADREGRSVSAYVARVLEREVSKVSPTAAGASATLFSDG